MKRVTLHDVAAHAGVSTSAASLVVRGVGRLSDGTRGRVKASIDALGYVYHRGAATLRSQKSAVVGLIVTDVSNPFFSAMALGLEHTLSGHGYVTVLTNTFDEADRSNQLVREMLEFPVAALVYVPVAGADLSFASYTAMRNTPCLAVTRDPGSKMAFLGIDERLGGRLAANHLIEAHARTRLVYLGGPAYAGPRSARLEGVRREVARHPKVRLVAQLPGATNISSGVALAERVLTSGMRFDAVICHSDVIAYALCSALRHRKIDVPTEVSVVGFDGLDTSEVFAPSISSVSSDPRHMGTLAARWVVDALEGIETPRRRRIRPTLAQRQSCGCEDA